MSLRKENYKDRLVDKKLELYLSVFGAVSIEGPKWCGKTWTSLNFANTVTYVTDKGPRNLALVDPKYIFEENRPQLIDEWQLVPEIWDAVRHECDSSSKKGNFILTGSTSLSKEEVEKEVFHSGAGRIASIKMYPMSLYESGESSGKVSLNDLFNNKVEEGHIKKTELDELAYYIIRGGWPENLNIKRENAGIIPKSYIEAIVTKDIHERKDKKRDSLKMKMLFRSLSRNESTIASNDRIVKDIMEFENKEEMIESRQTVVDYIGVLDSLHLISDLEAYSLNYRSSDRIGKSPKRHLVDPSLACAALNLTEEKLMYDHKTFGYLFESLVTRDLRIYADYLDGNIYHFRDNISGDEVDIILEFPDGEYGAFEIKLTQIGLDDGKKSLLKFYENVKKKPKFMCIIVGHYEAIVKDKETGIYIVPITALKP